MSELLITSLVNVLSEIHNDPSILKKNDAVVKAKLQSQGKKDSQGTGNQVTPQETSFAILLEKYGFTFISKEKKNDHLIYIEANDLNDGLYYIYQVNGSQASIDFAAFHLVKKAIVKQFNFDLKHTTNNIFYLNDGWFHKDIIYIVSWSEKKTLKSFIGLGQNIPSKEDSERMEKLLQIKKTMNTTENKKVGSLITYIRFANRYSCEKFDTNFTKENFEKLLSYIRT